jgi:multidrug resistance efflux pump
VKRGGINNLTARRIFAAEPGMYTDGLGLSLRVCKQGANWQFRSGVADGQKRIDASLGPANLESVLMAEKSLYFARHAAKRLTELAAKHQLDEAAINSARSELQSNQAAASGAPDIESEKAQLRSMISSEDAIENFAVAMANAAYMAVKAAAFKYCP